jgi:hypothetical protein
MVGMEAEEGHDGPEELFDVVGLGLFTAAGVGSPAFGVAVSGPVGFKFGTKAANGLCWCPDSSGEDFASFLLLNHPVFACGFDSSCQGGIAGRQQ